MQETSKKNQVAFNGALDEVDLGISQIIASACLHDNYLLCISIVKSLLS